MMMYSTPITTKTTVAAATAFTTPLTAKQEKSNLEHEILDQVSRMTIVEQQIKTPMMQTPIMVRKRRPSCVTPPRPDDRQKVAKVQSIYISERMKDEPPMIPADLENPNSRSTNPFRTIQSLSNKQCNFSSSFASPPQSGYVSKINLDFFPRIEDSSRETSSRDITLKTAMRCSMAREMPNLGESPVQARSLRMRRPRYDVVFQG